jgi:hypothetical protein
MLTTGKDWDDWLARIKSKAVRGRFWHYIDPEIPEPHIPDEPQRPTLLAAGIDDVTTSTSDQRACYYLARSEYKLEWKIWDRLDTRLLDIANTIEATISRSYADVIIDCTTPWQMLTALRRVIAPNTTVREIEVLKKYKAACNGLNSANVDAWLLQWDKAYRDALRINLPETVGQRPLYAFLEAVELLDPTWAQAQRIFITKSVIQNTPCISIRSLIEDFDIERRFHVKGEGPPAPSF